MPRLLKKSFGRELNTPKDYSHFDKIREQKNMLHYDKRWKPLRDNFLTHNPCCWFCGVLASEVHHVEKGEDKFFDKSNLMPLCKKCHKNISMLLIRKSTFLTMMNSMGIKPDSWECMEKLRDSFNQKYNKKIIDAERDLL